MVPASRELPNGGDSYQTNDCTHNYSISTVIGATVENCEMQQEYMMRFPPRPTWSGRTSYRKRHLAVHTMHVFIQQFYANASLKGFKDEKAAPCPGELTVQWLICSSDMQWHKDRIKRNMESREAERRKPLTRVFLEKQKPMQKLNSWVGVNQGKVGGWGRGPLRPQAKVWRH